MSELSLSDDLIVITSEINIWKQQAGQAVFEIGKRLKHVKENDLAHGQWIPFLESVDIDRFTAAKMIQAYDQFSNVATSAHLPTGKIFEMLSLPETVDRQEFISTPHTIPETGESKTVDDMTVKELRQVKQQLRETENEKLRLSNESSYYKKLWDQEKGKPAQVITNTVEVVPPNLKKELEEKDFQLNSYKKGYQEANAKIRQYEMHNTIDFDAEQAKKQREKVQHEADFNTLDLRVQVNHFLEKVAINSFMQGALAAADPITKKKLYESIEMLESFTNQIKAALNGRILGGIVNE